MELCKKSSNVILNLSVILIINFYCIFTQTKLVQLSDIAYYQGLLSDKIVLNFDNPPICFCEPIQQEKPTEERLNSIGKTKSFAFLFPLSKAKSRNIGRVLNNISKAQKSYKILIKDSSIPNQNLACYLEFNIDSIGVEYGHARNGENSYIIQLNNKKNINFFNSIRTPLRWRTKIKKRPRVTISFDKKDTKLAYTVNLIKNNLTQNRVETIILGTNANYSGQVGYINCITKSDFHLTIKSDSSLNKEEPVKIVINRDNTFIRRKKNILPREEHNLKNIRNGTETKSEKSTQLLSQHALKLKREILAYQPQSAESGEFPFGLEMPSIAIAISDKNLNNKVYLKNLAQACAWAIVDTLKA